MIDVHSIWKHLLIDLNEANLVKYLKQLNLDFTQRRNNLDKYVLDESLVSAYTAFYLPTNIPKFNFLMNQLSKEIREEIKHTYLIDFGCGPGTFSLAFLDYFKEDILGITLIDQSTTMLKQAQKLISNLVALKNIDYQNTITGKSDRTTLLFGHSFNEIGFKKGTEIINMVAPEFLIFIEPGTKEVFSYINDLRIFMRDRGYACLYPCPSLNGNCPMSEREDDWCHGILRTTHHPDLERISQIVKLDRKMMPNIMHIYKKGAENGLCEYRLVRFLKNTKFSFELEICFADQGKPVIKQAQILKKSMTKRQIKEFEKTSVGTSLNIQIVKKLDTFWRAEFID